MTKKRNYKKEVKYHSSPEQKKNRAARGRSRYKLEKEGRVRKGDGKDVHHIDNTPTNTSRSNLRVESRSVNRARKTRKKK